MVRVNKKVSQNIPHGIGYFTDLHAESRPLRVPNAAAKMETARKSGVRAFCIGGDIFTLTGQQWAILKVGANEDQRKEMEDHSKKLVDHGAPLFIEAAGGLPIFIIKGNADHIAYEYMKKKYAGKFIFVDNMSPISLPPTRFVMLGLGGIPAPVGDRNAGIPQNSPWYRGVLTSTEYDALIRTGFSPDQIWAWVHTILMIHPPVKGHLDMYPDVPGHLGSQAWLDFVEQNHPLIVLCGHVHAGPFTFDAAGNIISRKSHSVVDNSTLLVNTGSQEGSDDVKVDIIDIDLAYRMRIDGKLEQGAGNCISPV